MQIWWQKQILMLNYQVLIKKITENKSKLLLVENELKKLKAFDSSYFRGKSHFEEDGKLFSISANVQIF